MARLFLAFTVIALATLQVVVAESYYCPRPKCPSYGSCKPYKSWYYPGHKVYFSCKDGYDVDGNSWAKCLYSKSYRRAYWSHKPPVCKSKLINHNKCMDVLILFFSGRVRLCPKLRLDYGFVKHTGFKPGDQALHFCNKCFKLVGDKVRYCQKNGYWTGKPPVCKSKCYIWSLNLIMRCFSLLFAVIDCGKPPRPDYGKVIFRSTKCGSKAVHVCNRRFVLVGDKFRKCLTNGYWSGKTPKCVPIKKKYY